MPRNHYFNNYAHNLIGFFLAIMSLSIKASENIVYYCEQDEMSVIDSKFIVDKFNKISRTKRLISNFKINPKINYLLSGARSKSICGKCTE